MQNTPITLTLATPSSLDTGVVEMKSTKEQNAIQTNCKALPPCMPILPLKGQK
jgi:hypothetical protein